MAQSTPITEEEIKLKIWTAICEKKSLSSVKNSFDHYKNYSKVVRRKIKSFYLEEYKKAFKFMMRSLLEEKIVEEKDSNFICAFEEDSTKVIESYGGPEKEALKKNETKYKSLINSIKNYGNFLINRFISRGPETAARMVMEEWFMSGEIGLNNFKLWDQWLKHNGTLQGLKTISWNNATRNDVVYSRFIDALKKVETTDFLDKKTFHQTAHELLKEPKINVIENESGFQADVKLEFVGRTIFFSKIVKEIRKIMNEKNLVEVDIFAHTVFHIDCSIKMPGINFVVVSGKVRLWDRQNIDVSGKTFDENESRKANDGGTCTDGSNGKNGHAGFSSGNISILSQNIVNGNLLTLILNGGNGQNGEHGGNGGNGTNGYQMSQSDFDSTRVQYGSIYWTSWSHFYDWTPSSTVWTNELRKIDKDSGYIYEEYVDKNGCRLIYSAAGWKESWWHSTTYDLYVMVKGTDGKMGGCGGAGGYGGAGGNSGECIVLNTVTNKPITEFNVIATAGKSGSDGKNGVGGVNGTHGGDIAMIDRSTTGGCKHYFGNNDNVRLERKYFLGDDSYRRFDGYKRHAKNDADCFMRLYSSELGTSSQRSETRQRQTQENQKNMSEAKKTIVLEEVQARAEALFEEENCEMTCVVETKVNQKEEEEVEQEEEETVEEEITIIRDHDDSDQSFMLNRNQQLTGEEYCIQVKVGGLKKTPGQVTQILIDLFTFELNQKQLDDLDSFFLKLLPIRYNRIVQEKLCLAVIASIQNQKANGLTYNELIQLSSEFIVKKENKIKFTKLREQAEVIVNEIRTSKPENSLSNSITPIKDDNGYLRQVKPDTVDCTSKFDVEKIVKAFYNRYLTNQATLSTMEAAYTPWKFIHNDLLKDGLVQEFDQGDNFDWGDDDAREKILAQYFPSAVKEMLLERFDYIKKLKAKAQNVAREALSLNTEEEKNSVLEGKFEPEMITPVIDESQSIDPKVKEIIETIMDTVAKNHQHYTKQFENWSKVVAEDEKLVVKFGKVPTFSKTSSKNNSAVAYLIRFYYQFLNLFTFQRHIYRITQLSNSGYFIPNRSSIFLKDKNDDLLFFNFLKEAKAKPLDVSSSDPMIIMKERGINCAGFRYLVAYASKINIRVYGQENFGDFILLENFNPKCEEICWFLAVDGADQLYQPMPDENLRNLMATTKLEKCPVFDEMQEFVSKISSDNDFTKKIWLQKFAKFFQANFYGSITEWIIKYITITNDQSLIKLFYHRFCLDGIHLAVIEFQFILNTAMMLISFCKVPSEFVFNLVSSFPQSQLVSIFLYWKIQIVWRRHIKEEYAAEILSAMNNVAKPNLKPLFGSKLTDCPMNEEILLKILTMLQHSSDNNLEKMNLSEWISIAEHQQWSIIGDKISECGSIGYYFAFLDHFRNPYEPVLRECFKEMEGLHIMEKLMARLTYLVAYKEVEVDNIFLTNIKDIFSYVSQLFDDLDGDEQIVEGQFHLVTNEYKQNMVLAELRENEPELLDSLFPSQPRNLKALNELMKSHNPDAGEASPQWISEMCKELSNKESFYNKWIIAIDNVMFEKKKIRLRDTQKLAIMTIASNKSNLLAQVNTGEGKSFIIAALAIIRAKEFGFLDIITSSPVLAQRDGEEMKVVYEAFGLTVGHNCDEQLEKRKLAYKANIIYGDIPRFQRDYLLHHFYKRNILGDRIQKAVIVDEVDNMLLDNGNNMLYLSHQVPGLECLDSLFLFIHKIVNMPLMNTQMSQTEIEKSYETSAIREKVLSYLKGKISKKDLLVGANNPLNVEKTWDKLLDLNIIDVDGYLINADKFPEVGNIVEDELNKIVPSPLICRTIGCLSAVSCREKKIIFPQYLTDFCLIHLDEFIENSKRAMSLKHNVEYVIDLDHTKQDSDLQPKVTIIDQNTGVDLATSQWSEGLHQMVQLKHGCRLQSITLKAVFISNVTYLLGYQKINGLSGTLGSAEESRALRELYSAELIRIPTSKPKNFYEHVPVICTTEEQWVASVYEEIKDQVDEDRSVLIICRSIEDAMFLSKELRILDEENYGYVTEPLAEMIIYQREFEQFNFTTESTLATSKIILSTNLAGRGTDIKLSDDLLEAGGLHVIVTFLPENSRIEDQAYGRAARCGNPGSGQIIAFIKNDSQEVPSVFQLKEFRNNKEVHRIKSLKNFYKFHTEIEEICLNQFRIHCSKAMESVTQFSSNGEEKLPTLEQIIYFSLLDEWALWLDTKSPLIRQCAKNCDESEKTAIIDSVKQFLVHHPVTPTNTALQWIQSPHSLLTATLIYIHGNNLEAAKNLLDRVVNEFPEFSGEAFYYRAVLQQWQIRSAKELPKDPKILQGLFAGDNKKVESSETEVTVEASNPVAKYFNNYCKTQISRIKKGNEKFGKGEFINGTWEYAKFTMDSMSYSIAGHLGTGVREIGKGSVNLVNLGLGWLSKQGNSIIKDINPDYIIDSLINIDELKVLETQEFFHHARYHFELKNIRRDEAATIVRRLQDIDKSQTVKVNGFEEQTIQIKRLVNGIISNIDDMVGSVIDIKTFEFDNNRLKAYKRFKHLERLGYISPPLLCLQELPCQLNVFKEKYFISRKVLQKMLHFARTFKYRVEYHGRAILSEDILADYLPLPSRKEFWTDLSRKGCFSEEIKCFKIDPTRKHLISFQRNLQNFNFKKYSDKFNLCITLTNSNFMESEVAKSYCTAACILNLLKNKKIDEDELQYLIEEEIIIPDIFGIINKEKFLSLNYLEKFDGITVNGLADFLEVSEAFSITVIQQLVDADILLPTFCSMTSMNISFEPKETIVAGICLSKELMQRFKDYSYLENISCDVVQCVFGLKTLEEVITVTSHLIKEEILKPFEKEIYVLQPSVDIDCSILSACIRDDVEAFLLHCSSYTLAYYSLRENILSTKPQHKIIILPLDPYKNLHNDFVKYGLIMPQRFERNEEMFVDYDCTDNPTKMKEIVKEHSTMLTEKKAALQSTQDYLVKKEITLPLDVRKTVINSLREIATISSNASLWWLWLAVGAILAMIIIIALTPFLGPIALIIAKILIFGLLVTAAVGTIAYFIQLHQAKIRTHSTKYQQREETEEFTTMLKYHEEAVESSEKLRRQNLITQECEKVLKSVTEYLEEEMMSRLQISSKSKILVYNACQRYNVTTDEFKEVLESTLKDSTSMRFIEETLKIHLEKMQHEIVGSMYLCMYENIQDETKTSLILKNFKALMEELKDEDKNEGEKIIDEKKENNRPSELVFTGTKESFADGIRSCFHLHNDNPEKCKYVQVVTTTPERYSLTSHVLIIYPNSLAKVKVLIYPIEDPSLLRNAKFHIHSAYSSTDSISPDEFWQTVIPSEFSTSEIPVRFNIKPNEEAVDEVFRFICMDAIDKLTIDFEEGLKQKSTAENTERKMAMNKFEHWKSHLTSTLKGTLHQMFSNLVHTPSKDALISYIKNCAKQIPKTDEQKEFEEKQLRKKQHLKENSLFIAANRKVRFIGRDVEEIFRVMWNQKSNLQLLKHMILFDHALPPSSVKIVIDAVFHVLTDINPSIGSLNVTLFDKTQKLLLYIRRNSSGLQKIDLNLHLINGGYYLGCIEDFNNQKTKVLQNSIFEMLQSLLKHSKYAENNVFKQNVVNNLRDFKSDDKNEVQWFVDKTELAYCNSIIVYDSNKITEFETFNENNG